MMEDFRFSIFDFGLNRSLHFQSKIKNQKSKIKKSPWLNRLASPSRSPP